MIIQENIPYTADEIKAMLKTCEKYNKALENAKKLYGKSCINNVLEDLFPELKESEDEKIRKTLIEYIKGIKSWNYFLGISKGQMIAWLEKQGEQTHAELSQQEVTKTSDQELSDKIEPKKIDADKVIAWLVANICDFEYYVKLFKKDFGLTKKGGEE